MQRFVKERALSALSFCLYECCFSHQREGALGSRSANVWAIR